MDIPQIKNPEEVYDCLIKVALFNHPLEEIRPHFDDNFMGYGSAEDEVLHGWEGYKWMVERQRGELGNESLKINRIPIVQNIDHDNGSAYFVEEFEFVSANEGDEQRFSLRLTSLLSYKGDRWILSHFHGSFPDVNTPEGQAWPIEEWKRRNAELQAAVDEKTAELQARNRDLEIEAALERVRGRAMSMRNSEELADLVTLVFQELTSLDMELTRCLIWIFNEDHSAQWWMANSEDPSKADLYHISNHSHAPFQAFLNGWKENQKIWEYHLEGQDKKEWDKYLFNETELVRLPIYVQEAMQAPDQIILTASFNKFGALQSAGLEPLSSENQEILKRFGQVFDQTYTRFQDLKKAEAQAREAQIEAALEKVRTRTMAMHKSQELNQVIQVIHDQLVNLGFSVDNSGILLDYLENDDFNLWMADSYETFPFKVHIPFFNHPHFIKYKKAKEKGLDLFCNTMSFEEKNQWFGYIWKNHHVEITEETQKTVFNAPGYAISSVFMKDVGLGLYVINYDGTPYSKNENNILKRFGFVFEQTYIRFLDLQKAEAQAREAQVEAALEKIRALVASMQESSDLLDIMVAIRRAFVSLGHEAHYFWYMHWLPEIYEKAMTSGDGTKIGNVLKLPRKIHGEIPDIAKWENGKDPAIIHVMDPEAAIDYVHKMIEWGDFEQVDQNVPTDDILRQIGGLTYVMARTSQGEIGYSLPGMVPDPPREAVDTLVRFATVFDLAYSRFEDLKESEFQAQKLLEEKNRLERALSELKAAQAQLIHAEKMASLGELTAGIAHEIQNPLNFVNNFSEVSSEILGEMEEELEAGDAEEVKAILDDLKGNLEKITHHGHRASGIVRSMLDHSRTSAGEKVATDINALCDEYLRLAYHGMRAKNRNFNAAMETLFDDSIPRIKVIPQDIGRVLLNLINNAFQAVSEGEDLTGFANEKNKTATVISDSGSKSYSSNLAGLAPKVKVSTKNRGDQIEVSVTDNGPGIPEEIKEKIFQPFFTTKPTGQGTGLGLSLSYDIIKAHGGEMRVQSGNDQGAEFVILIPI